MVLSDEKPESLLDLLSSSPSHTNTQSLLLSLVPTLAAGTIPDSPFELPAVLWVGKLNK